MKKIISMLAVLCMLITSVNLTVTAEEVADEVTDFTAEDRVVYMNKDATRHNKLLQSNDNTINNDDLWTPNTNFRFNKKTASNGTEYVQFDPETESYIGANNPTGQRIKGKVYNQKKLTVETWISIDDIDQAFVSLFATTNKNSHNVQTAGMWQLYVQDSKLKHKYNDTTFFEMDLNEYEGKFMHLVITRDVQDDKIVLETIINGESKGTKEFTGNITALLENPDGDLSNGSTTVWFFGGFREGNAATQLMNFSGRVGEMNVYQNVMTATQASTLCNRDKEKYNFDPEKGYGFKKNEVFYHNIQNGVNDDAHLDSWMVVNKVSNWVTGWHSGTVNRKNVTGSNGRKFSYFDYEPYASETPRYFGSDNPNEKAQSTIRNQPETTVELWLSVDDLLLGDVINKKTIFYTGTGYPYSTDKVKWHIYVQDGKIKQAYDDDTIANEIDITQLGGQFIHLAATRKVDTSASTITYDLYVNENKATTCTRNDLSNDIINNPDGKQEEKNSVWAVGGIFYTSSQIFVGKIARFNVYDKVADEETVKALYNEEKETYDIGTDTERLTYTNNVNQVASLRADKTVYADKNYTNDKYFYVIGDLSKNDTNYGGEGNWGGKRPTVVTGTNANGGKYSYFDFSDGQNHFIGGNNSANHKFLNHVCNQDKTTIETWISIDDMMAGRVDSYRNIFFFSNSQSDGYNSDGSKGTWSMFVQNGQLRQTYENGKTACNNIELGEYVGKFIHIVATRNIERKDDNSISKITYQTYFNGKAQTPVVLEAKEATEEAEAVSLSVTQEHNFFLGGTYGKANNGFVGKVAEFNFFNKIMSAEDAKTIYDAEKDKYTLTEKTAEQEYADFKNAKALYLNKDITTESPNYLLIPSEKKTDSSKQWNWTIGMQTIASGVNKNGETYTYYPFTANTNSCIGSDSYDGHYINNVISDRKKISIEMWIAVDDIMNASETGSRQIFGTGNSDVAKGNWQLLVKNGKLVHSYKGEVMDEIDITGYKSEFVHLVLTRDVNDESISFNTYFNGEKQTGKNIAVATNVANKPDGAVWTFGDGFNDNVPGTKIYQIDEAKRFVGKIADIVVYQDVMEPSMATTLYNETKDTYACEHTIKIASAEFSDDDENTVANLKNFTGSQIYATYTLNNISARYTKKAYVTVALYNGNRLVAINGKSVTLEPGKSTGSEQGDDCLTLEIPKKEDESCDIDENSVIKMFVWSADEGEEMQPYGIASGCEADVNMELTYTAEEGL